MKGFKFKLDALLKIRKLREEECKQKIGRTQIEITKLKKKISQNDIDMAEVYETQENMLNSGATGQQVKFFPFFMQGKRSHNQQIFQEIEELEKKLKEQFLELNELRGQVKVLANLEEKERLSYKKAVEKKMFEKIEEQIIIQNKHGK